MNSTLPRQTVLFGLGLVFAFAKVIVIIVIQLSPEEMERRMIRRERNKLAAAKCRNRRRELTDTLQNVSN